MTNGRLWLILLLAFGIGCAQAAKQRAQSADAFVDTIGVCTHLSYKGEYQHYDDIIKPRLLELGVRTIRDGVEEKTTEKVLDLHRTAGIRLIGLIGPNNLAMSVSVAGKLHEAGALFAVEGENEPDLGYGAAWPQRTREHQIALHAALKTNPATAKIPLATPALCKLFADGPSGSIIDNAQLLGDLSAYSDYGALHTYPWSGDPTKVHGVAKWGGTLAQELVHGRVIYGDHPVIVTETGYQDLLDFRWHNKAVPPEVEAKYLPRLFLHYFQAGVVRTCTYEFIDHTPGVPRAAVEQHFGLLLKDGTPKPVFLALKNLIALLRDPGPAFKPGTLDYTLTGGALQLQQLLLQKRDGTFYLVLWQEVESFNVYTKETVEIPPLPVTLTFKKSQGYITTYLPVNGNDAVQTYGKTRTLTLEVPDHPLVVKLAR